MNKKEPNENLFEFILVSIQNSYANVEVNKCLVDNHDDDLVTTEFTKCWCKILDYLSEARETNPFVKYFQSSIESFHSKHVCSSKTLILFAALLWKQLKSTIIKNDLSPKKINIYLTNLMSQIINSIELNQSISLNLESKLNHIKSRHLITKSKDYTQIKPIINGICRNETTISTLISNLLDEHLNLNLDFDYDKILIQTSSTRSKIDCVENDESFKSFNYAISNGLLISLSEINYRILNKIKQGEYLNAITVDGSLVFDYQFLGFNKNLSFSQFYSHEDHNEETSQLAWQKQLRDLLIRHDLKILFIRGNIDKDLNNFCLVNSIVVCSNMSNDQFKHIINSYDFIPITYLDDLDSNNIFKIQVNLSELLNDYYLNLNDSSLFSVVIQSKLKSTLGLYKEQLRHSLKRVHNIVSNCHYLKGDATVEKFIINQMDKITSNENDDLVYFNIVRECLKNVFEIIYSIIIRNKSIELCETTYDDFESKIEAWKTACLINKYLLSIDLFIHI